MRKIGIHFIIYRPYAVLTINRQVTVKSWNSAHASAVLLAVYKRSFSRPLFFMNNSVQSYVKSSPIRTMVYCFIWRSQQPEALQESIALSKPTNSEHYSKWKCNSAIVHQCKQRGVLYHIGSVSDHGQSSSQPTLFFSFWEVLKNNTWKLVSTIRKTNKHGTWWRKCTNESACLCRGRWAQSSFFICSKSWKRWTLKFPWWFSLITAVVLKWNFRWWAAVVTSYRESCVFATQK